MKRTVMFSLATAVIVTTALGAGCGVDDAGTQRLWGSVQRSLGRTGSPGSQSQALTASFDFDVDCAKSGTASLTAKLDVDDSLVNTVNALFGYDVRYDACQPDDNTLDGELHYAAAVDAGSSDTGAAIAVRTVYQGSVTSSGDTNGTCDIDVVGHVNAAAGQAPGDEFKSNVDIEYSGTICGHDAHEVLNASASVDASSP